MTKEQRIKYKAEFNQEYAKYRKHHNVLDQVSKRFSHLETKLKQHQRGSEGFKVRTQYGGWVMSRNLTLCCFRM